MRHTLAGPTVPGFHWLSSERQVRLCLALMDGPVVFEHLSYDDSKGFRHNWSTVRSLAWKEIVGFHGEYPVKTVTLTALGRTVLEYHQCVVLGEDVVFHKALSKVWISGREE